MIFQALKHINIVDQNVIFIVENYQTLKTFSVRDNRKTKYESDDCVKRCIDKIWELLKCNASILKLSTMNTLVVNTKGKHISVKCILNT